LSPRDNGKYVVADLGGWWQVWRFCLDIRLEIMALDLEAGGRLNLNL